MKSPFAWRYFWYFLASFATISGIGMTFSPQSAGNKQVITVNTPLTRLQLDSISQKTGGIISFSTDTGGTSATDIVHWLLSALGGLLTTIIMYFLHRWFPNIFPSAKIKDYPGTSPGRPSN